jgi:hypothetical protein
MTITVRTIEELAPKTDDREERTYEGVDEFVAGEKERFDPCVYEVIDTLAEFIARGEYIGALEMFLGVEIDVE